ncbi:MAG: NAD-glutamate dehydrogenase [Solirubrobacteraceae bacterium]
MSLAEERGTRPEDRLLELIDEQVAPEHAQAVRAFARAYLRRLASDGSEGISADALLAEVVGLFEFACSRDGEALAVRAFNPTREQHGYEPIGSVLETNTDDLPFLVDSVSGELESRGLHVSRLLHPIMATERDGSGRIRTVRDPRGAPHRESVMHFDIDRRLSDDELADLEHGVREVLAAVRAVVRDFPAMLERVTAMSKLARAGASRYAADEVEEVVDFLAWLQRGEFVFLGAREYDFTQDSISLVPGSGLGILADESKSAFVRDGGVSFDELPEFVRRSALEGDLLLVDKSNAPAPVHRRERMDYIGVRRVGDDGEIVGMSRVIGLFTTKAYAEPASETPLLGRKLRQCLDGLGLIEGSHDYKAAVALFDTFPKDELFAAPTDDLRGAVRSLLALEGTSKVRLLGRRDADGRNASLILTLPRARYDAALVERVRGLFRRRFGTSKVEAHHVLDESERSRVHFLVHAPGELPELALRALEREVIELTRTWDDELRDLLIARHGPIAGRRLAEAWLGRFPEHYKGYTATESAVHDIGCFGRLTEGEGHVVSLQPLAEQTRVCLYKQGAKVELSEAMPMLEDLGLRVIEELSTRLIGEEDELWVQEFRVLGPGSEPLDVAVCGDGVAKATAAVWRGDAESDSLNRLVVTAQLDGHQLAILRAYRKYRQRVGSRFTESYQNDVLVANSALTAKLVRYFEARFDPGRERDEAAEHALREEILGDLDEVASLDHDRILRNQLSLIDATLRTSAFRPDGAAMAFKLRSADVPAMPEPAPVYEIYVYSPEMEGIHLRGGRIARGGIRWSDRMDYRTEVYGLMRAQLTKNAIIVPAGAKGGFILKRVPTGRAELVAEVERQYETYVRSLLDVTDNLVDGEVVHPPQVRVLDEDDTYLVVAADKGTATLSDTANRIAREYGFWLDDAFASGGSAGYDHKKLGITARGAWESVKRHFRELDLDPAVDELTAVGIGDMSGDVFGNGMLLSDKIRLVAAYDHRHVFIDPSPDAAGSFAERKRLFELAGSSWDDYDRELISAGGGVWPRSAKAIPLSPEAGEALGTDEERPAPTDVIRAILRAPVDLLWNGGIGTVVKASAETDADAHDRSSDAIRVDARDLRARVVGEGGNLGFTRRARVEFSARGGRINADFIDNSAGVDCSDHEVNLKILLGLAERRGEMTREQRDELLEAVTDDVVAHVLYDSFLQAQIIGQEVERSAARLYAYEDLMTLLEELDLLNRASENLPDGEEIAERRRAGRGMERPELAVLVAYAKRWVARALERSSFVEDPWLERDLRGYFPPAVVERCSHLLGEHPLRRQLLCMSSANSIVNALGPTFVSQLVAERGCDPADVVRAYRIARAVTGAAARWDAVERLEGIKRELQAELMAGVDAAVDSATRWYLAWAPDGDLATVTAAGREGVERLTEALPGLGTEERRERRGQTVERLIAKGVPEEVALAHALGAELAHAPDMVAVAAGSGRELVDVAKVFFAVGAELRLDWLESELDGVRAVTRMQRWALLAVREDAARARRELAQTALEESPGRSPAEAVERFLHTRADAARRLAGFLRALSREGEPDLAGLTLAVRQLRTIVGS